MAAKLPPQEALSHVLYEMWMFSESLLRLSARLPLDQFENNLHLEGFVIHVRCLDEFFNTNRRKKSADDILPTYFGYTGAKALYAKRVSTVRMHKEMAHLSHARKSNPADKRWTPYAEILKIAPVCIDFLKFVAQDAALMGFQSNKAVCFNALRIIERLFARAKQTD